jgi:hypothetical protein
VVRRGDPEREAAIWCLHNVSAKEIEFEWPGKTLASRPALVDLLQGDPTLAEGRVSLQPYEVRWLRQ